MGSGLLPKSSVISSLCDEVPSHIYSKIASRAQRIFDQQCKKTFATISAQSGHSRHRNILSAIGVTADIEQPLLSNLSRPTRGCTLKGSVPLSFDRGQCVTARRSAAIFLNRASPVWVS